MNLLWQHRPLRSTRLLLQRGSAVSAIPGNFLHIHQAAGTIRYICGHTCAKTQHKPLSQKKMHAQIAAM
ncbi:hypothetical protein [Pseudomonas putida]|uniref:hypothetical protein n=1 Tax=Pseudomonas putida TaxID=303 RepID=UPI002769A114|nr:hypothetical protein [Pseudomonas putida]EKT4480134.1 hypothetical protein [Pseudomonas putida]MDP9522016.1 hypothetical protein [Pseudomonas putida]